MQMQMQMSKDYLEARDLVAQALEDFTPNEIVQAWNEYCYDNKYYDDVLESIDYINMILDNKSPEYIIEKTKEVDLSDDYVKCDSTFEYYFSVRAQDVFDYIDFRALAEYVIDNDLYLTDSIRDIILDLKGKEDEK